LPGTVFCIQLDSVQTLRVTTLAVMLAAGFFSASADTNKTAMANKPPAYTSTWDGVQLEQIFDVYAGISGRTMLVHPGVKRVAITLFVHDKTKAEFQKAIEDVLRENDIAIVPDGDIFALIVPAEEEKKWSAYVKSFPSPPAVAEKGKYSFTYDGVDVRQAMPVYGALTGRKWIETALPPASVKLKTLHGLGKAESMHAFDVIFALNGLKVVNVGDDSFKVVPVAGRNN
jgi:hypothetical protein